MRRDNQLIDVFQCLLKHFGPLSWWPADTPFEVCIGAILTQNTAWGNVEKAIANLKRAAVMTPAAIHGIDADRLADLIRPAGYFNVKSSRLKYFVDWLFTAYGGSLDVMFAGDWQVLRRELLLVKGIGPETCDAILLYAGNKPTFVVDAYTRRLFGRLGITAADAGYDQVRGMCMHELDADPALFNEYHALIVEQCKQFCRKKPLCSRCILSKNCPSAVAA